MDEEAFSTQWGMFWGENLLRIVRHDDATYLRLENPKNRELIWETETGKVIIVAMASNYFLRLGRTAQELLCIDLNTGKAVLVFRLFTCSTVHLTDSPCLPDLSTDYTNFH